MSEELKIDPKDTREEVYEVPINPPKDPPGGFPPLKDFSITRFRETVRTFLNFNFTNEI